MKAKLQEYALIAEIIGAICIVISLIFVGIQVKDNTTASEAATYQASVGYDIELLMAVAGDPDMARIVSTYIYGDSSSLSELDTTRAEYQMTALLRHLENLYSQHELGLLSDETWATRQAFVEAILLSPGYERYQTSPLARNFSGRFKAYASQVRAEAAQ